MAQYPIGSIVFLDYYERPRCLHARLIVGHVDGADHIIATPDFDVYTETLDMTNPDIVGCHPAAAGGRVPAGINPRDVYSVAPMGADELANLMDQGRIEAGLERGRRGLAPVAAPAVGGAPVAAAAGAPVVGPVAGVDVWAVADVIDSKKIGDRVQPPSCGHGYFG